MEGLGGTLRVGTWVRIGDVTCVTCVTLEGQRHHLNSGLLFWTVSFETVFVLQCFDVEVM